MKTERPNETSISRLARDRGGNFAIMTAVALPVAIFAVGIAIDLIHALEVRTDMQAAVDAASLSASSVMIGSASYTEATARSEAKSLVVTQLSQTLGKSAGGGSIADDLEKNTDVQLAKVPSATAISYTATVKTTFSMPLNPMTALFAGNSLKISASSSSTSARQDAVGMSMYLVLDKSGSMSFQTDTRKLDEKGNTTECVNYTKDNWNYNGITDTKNPNYIRPSTCNIRKIEALKSASLALLDTLDKNDPDASLFRVGAVAYTHETDKKPQKIDWGTSGARTYVNALPYKPLGGTDSSGAMTLAYNDLKSAKPSPNENTAHDAKNHDSFKRYILLMTDGEMTGESADWNEALDNATRTVCDNARKDGITIYSVAFMAPDKGKDLLNYCASGTSSYYEATSMESLIAAFEDVAKKATEATVRLTN